MYISIDHCDNTLCDIHWYKIRNEDILLYTGELLPLLCCIQKKDTRVFFLDRCEDTIINNIYFCSGHLIKEIPIEKFGSILPKSTI